MTHPLSPALDYCFGDDFTEHARAEFWWLTRSGQWLGLCAAHCAEWRRQSAENPEGSFPPQRVTNQRPRNESEES